MNDKKLTIMYMYGGRPYLDRISRDFLMESLGDFSDYEWVELDCLNLTMGAGFNRLVEKVNTEFVLYALDDFAFFPNGNWVDQAIQILDERHDVGMIDLRKERDGERPWILIEREMAGNLFFYTFLPWDNRGFCLNPSMYRTETLKQIVPIKEDDLTGNISEADGWDKWKELGLKSARLDISYLGVCFHMGWRRSCFYGYKEQQQEIIKKYYGKL